MTTAEENIQALIDEGQPLVRSLATKISRSIPMRIELDDLLAYGQVGLTEAARDFDPERGNRFTTFAYYRVRGAIYDGISKMSWTSRARYNRMRYEQMANETMREVNETLPSSEEPSLEDEAKWLRGVTERLAVVYLASEGGGEGDWTESALEDPAESPSTIAATRELSQKLRELVETLPPAERRLIRTIYFEGTTLQEAANRLGISKSWASRMHAKTLGTLANKLQKLGVDAGEARGRW
ncbi:MAG: sigma-70 family RNA polymerase sigma factor [Pirellulaceae bacterium]|nr:sigma-70 family RNA polymerase sigma factor [Pirellulaceae bacterium]